MNPTETLLFLDKLQESRMRLDLRPSLELLKMLGNPDKNLRSVIVAGTNGKGSTCAYLTAIGQASGLNMGTYTSPHLESIYERICINGKPINPELFAEVASDIRIVLDAQPFHKTTYFEFITMLAVVTFKREKVDLAIFEVGLGGRLDTTNALERMGVAITRIGLDHTAILGKTLGLIAREKGAIMRPEKFAVISSQLKEAEDEFRSMSDQLKIHPVYFGEGYFGGGDSSTFTFRNRNMELGPIKLGIPGDHQVMNAAVAAQVACELSAQGFPFSKETISEGLQNARVPGRLECWKLKDGKEVWLDVAHNEDSMKALVAYFIQQKLTPVDVVIGMLKDKDWKMVLEILKPIAKTVTFCRPNSTRAWDLTHTPPVMAFEKAIEDSPRLLCTGSFYVVGEIRSHLVKSRNETDH